MELKSQEIVGGKCFAAKALADSPPLVQSGKVIIQAHHIGWLVCGIFTLIACAVSFWLVDKHLQWYTNKKEQRYVVRILFLVPLYAVISFGSYLFWDHSTAIIIIRDCYESTVLTAFFYLLLLYLSPSPDEQRLIFRRKGLSKENDRAHRRLGIKEQHWMFPLGSIKAKPKDGIYFLQMMKWGVLQYCVIRPVTTVIAVILNYNGLYCESSWSPGWGHLYIVVIVSISVSIAMYCLIQLYLPIASELEHHRPILKLLAIKAVVFLTFWQGTFLSVLAFFKVIKDTQYMTANDINIGIGAIAECVEMSIFAVIHIKAFTYKVYVPEGSPFASDGPSLRTDRWPSLVHAFNFAETLRELSNGFLYMVDRLVGRDPRPDYNVRRLVVLDEVFPESKRFTRTLPTEAHSHSTEKLPPLDAGEQEPTLPLIRNAPSRRTSNQHSEQRLYEVSRQYEERLMVGPADRYGQTLYSPLPEAEVREYRRARRNRRSYTIDAPGHFDDPPPLSALQAYRESRHLPTPQDSVVAPPVLRLQEASEREAPPSNMARMDSVLKRIFPDSNSNSDINSNSSSQSHNQPKDKKRSRSPMGAVVPQTLPAEASNPIPTGPAQRSKSMKAEVLYSPVLPASDTPIPIPPPKPEPILRPPPIASRPSRRASAPLSFVVNEPTPYSESLAQDTFYYHHDTDFTNHSRM